MRVRCVRIPTELPFLHATLAGWERLHATYRGDFVVALDPITWRREGAGSNIQSGGKLTFAGVPHSLQAVTEEFY